MGKEVFVELSLLEALRFCEEKVYHLKQRAATLLDKKITIETHINVIVAHLEQLRRSLGK